MIDTNGRPLGDAQVELVRRANPFDLYRLRSGQDGRFVFSDLRAGTFRIRTAAATSRVPGDGEDAWQDPAFLESLIGRASTVMLSEGRTSSVTLRLDGR